MMYKDKRMKKMYGSKTMMNRGGYASGGKMAHKSISDMERSCSSKTSMNTMSEKRG